jgi:phospholipase/lecithinase/hemolysin
MEAAVSSPGSYGLVNVTQAVCSATLPDCDTNSLVLNGNAGTWLWADDIRLSSGGQTRLGQLATARALNNPFASN